jgi:hypothetical protein
MLSWLHSEVDALLTGAVFCSWTFQVTVNFAGTGLTLARGPQITSVSPTISAPSGGARITINGEGFGRPGTAPGPFVPSTADRQSARPT